MNPGPLTLRSLLRMARAKQEAEWDRTALLAALIRNAAVAKESDLVSVAHFNPYHQAEKKPLPKLSRRESVKLFAAALGCK